MSNSDDLIRERLNRLRSESQHLPATQSSSSLPPRNTKSSVEEVEFLLQRLSAQTELEERSIQNRLDVDSQIRARLDKLKAESAGLVAPVRISGLTTDDIPSPPAVDTFADSDVDDSDTCVMCDAKPTLRCAGCYNDLYCAKCFNECHDPGENHQTKAV